jgi:hypothetical protein
VIIIIPFTANHFLNDAGGPAGMTGIVWLACPNLFLIFCALLFRATRQPDNAQRTTEHLLSCQTPGSMCTRLPSVLASRGNRRLFPKPEMLIPFLDMLWSRPSAAASLMLLDHVASRSKDRSESILFASSQFNACATALVFCLSGMDCSALFGPAEPHLVTQPSPGESEEAIRMMYRCAAAV